MPKAEQVYTSAVMAMMLEEAAVNGAKEAPGKVAAVGQKSVGYISTEYAYLYPPGSPLVVPGGKVTQEIADTLQRYRDLKFTIEGLQKDGCIEVWIDG